ncbi:hypothetical protein [Pseudomonas sp. CFBP 5748]
MADHYRAAADMVVKWTLSDSRLCNIGVAEWFPSFEAKQRLLGYWILGSSSFRNRIGKSGSSATFAHHYLVFKVLNKPEVFVEMRLRKSMSMSVLSTTKIRSGC